MARTNSDARKTLKELVDEIKKIFKKHSRTSRKRAWGALISKRAQKEIDKIVKNPTITISGSSRWLSWSEWVEQREN